MVVFQKKDGSVSKKRLQCFSKNYTIIFYNKYYLIHEKKSAESAESANTAYFWRKNPQLAPDFVNVSPKIHP